jgi:hypothetical protein
MSAIIRPEALKDMEKSILEQEFAEIWVQMYPDIHLMTKVPIAFSGRTVRRRGKLWADFAWDDGRPFVRRDGHLFLPPPGVIIECDGGVHRIKFEEDRQKEDIAYELGFKLHRLTSDRIFLNSPRIHDIAKDIQEIASKAESANDHIPLSLSHQSSSLGF